MLSYFWFVLLFVPCCWGGIMRTKDYDWKVKGQFKLSSEYEIILPCGEKAEITYQLNTECISSASDCAHQKYPFSRCQSSVVRQNTQSDFFQKFQSRTTHCYCCVTDFFAIQYHLRAYTDHRHSLMKACGV